MGEKRLVPRRRFAWFENGWKNTTIKDIGNTFYGGGTPKTTVNKYWNGNIPWIQSSDLVESLVFLGNPGRTITQFGLMNSATKLVPPNSITIVTRVGVGKLAFVPYEFSTSQDFLSISDLNVDYTFGTYALYKLLKTEKELVQGTSIKGLTKNELLSMCLNIPVEKEEQQKIGEFFKVLDERIANQERKIAKVKALKSAYLTEMFPAECGKVPKRRFAGFTGEWKERKLEDAFVVTGTGKSSFFSNENKSKENPYAVLGSTSVIGYDASYDYSGDFILTARVGANAGNLYRYSGKVKITDNTVFIKGENLDFIYYLFTKYNLKKLSFGTGQPLIKASELNNLTLMLPSKKEQQKIGQFFKNLDDQIATEETKLEKLKKMKEAYLEEMFV